MLRESRDERLLGRLAEGDGDAFWMLWSSHRDILLGLCRQRMRGIEADAEDALSEAMMRAFYRLPRHAANVRDVRAWLRRLTANVCTDIQQKAVRSSERESFSSESPFQSQQLPDQELLGSDEVRRMRRALAGISPRLREALVLRFWRELSYDEIATQLVIQPAAARKRIQRARAVLKAKYRDDSHFGKKMSRLGEVDGLSK